MTATRTVKTAMSSTVRMRFWAWASYMLTRGTKRWPVIDLRELHLRDLALRLVGELEVLLGRESEHPREHARRERLERGVVVADVAVVEAPGEGDLVLGRGEVLGEVLELLDRLQLWVVLRDGEQRAQRAAQLVLGLRSLLRRRGGTRGDGARAGLGHFVENAALVRRVALHGLDEVGDQVVPSLQLDVDVGPGFAHALAQRDEPVVRRDEDEREHDEDDEDHDPDFHVDLPFRVSMM